MAQGKSRAPVIAGVVIGAVAVAVAAGALVALKGGPVGLTGDLGPTASVMDASWQKTAASEVVPSDPDTIMWAGGRYLLFGGSCGEDSADCAASYDPEKDKWEQIANLPPDWDSDTDTVEDAAQVGDFVYILGWREVSETELKLLLASYDPAKDAWAEVAVPDTLVFTADDYLDIFAAGDKVVLQGAFYEADCEDETIAATVKPADVNFWVYDPDAKTWSDNAKAPNQLNPCDGAPTTLGVDGHVYYSSRTNVWLLDFATMKWSVLDNVPFELVDDTYNNHPDDGVAYDGKLYFSQNRQVFDPATKTWAEFPVPQAALEALERFDVSGFTVGNGFEVNGYAVDLPAGTWAKLPTPPGPETSVEEYEVEEVDEDNVEGEAEPVLWSAAGSPTTLFACSPSTSDQSLGEALGVTANDNGAYPSACYVAKLPK
ncbi:MAG: hypothetical protein LBR32_00350 [Propionibacteriaceae bacterium]|jgi:hypothetical protein|nr:hypothetical protein [Propionibacteriaceae bacterium]